DPFGGFDARSGNFPGRLGGSRLVPSIFFSSFTPTPHSAPNRTTSPFYTSPARFGIRFKFDNLGNLKASDGNYSAYNFASVTPALPPGDFKYARSYFDSSLAAVPFTPDPFHGFDALNADGTITPFTTVGPSGPNGISVPIANPFNPFTVGDVTLLVN